MNFSANLFSEYDKDANKKLSFYCRFSMILVSLVMLLNFLKIFKIGTQIYPVLSISVFILFIPTIIYDFLKWDSPKWRYFVMAILVLMSGLLYAFLSYHVIIMLVFPIVISITYCSKRFVWFTLIFGIPVMFFSHLASSYFTAVPDEPLIETRDVLLYGFFPRLLEYTAISAVCLSISGKVKKLIDRLAEKNNELYEEQENLISSLSSMIEAQSKETGSHVKRVSEYTKILCKALNMSDEEVWIVGLASMMHDLGKIIVSKRILEKQGKLTEDEFSEMKKHTLYGKKMLENSKGEILKISSQIAYEHHEFFDGNGYEGLKGEEISLYSRCVAIADVFDALVSKRNYKRAWTLDEAKNEIINQSGKKFDPLLVDIFAERFEDFVEVYNKYKDE